MSERRELACANCGKTGTLREEVTVEATGIRRGTPYAAPDGKVKVERGYVEDAEDGDVISEGDIFCSACDEVYGSWEDATAARSREYRCGECGWWGLQDWLHDQDCPGELEELHVPNYTPDQLVAA